MSAFRRLLTVDEARKSIFKHLKPKPLGTERTDLLTAQDRVLAIDVIAHLDIPPFDRSTVDGYAVRSADTFEARENNPIMLRVCGTVNIGEMPTVSVSIGQSAEIVTGAPMPRGADSVLMVEYTQRQDNNVRVFSAVTENENVMKTGADIMKGETVLKAGQLLGSKEIGVLAAVGHAKVCIYKTPKVAILSTGDEVIEPGRRLRKGRVYDINAYTLAAAVRESGGEPIYMGVFPDDKSILKAALKKALLAADVLVTSGGVSVGPKDLMPQLINSLGKPGVIVSGIAIKPGKPATMAVVNGKMIFSCPGHPTSALLVFYLFARPIIRLMAGREKERIPKIKALAATRMFPAKGRRTFVMVRLKRNGSRLPLAEPVETGLSGAITTLAKADGFVEIPENQQFVDLGDRVVVHLF